MPDLRFHYAHFFCFLLLSAWVACGKHEAAVDPNEFIFNPVDTTFVSSTLVIPSGKYKSAVLYKEGTDERVEWKNVMAPAKGKHDFIAYIPIKGSPTHGILWINHASGAPHDQIGDGGGASVMEIFRDTIQGWSIVGFPYAINFESVGGTLRNGLGVLTPWGTILTCESMEPANNRVLHPLTGDADRALMLRDTSDFEGWRRYQNFGWMVEVDPLKREVLGKRYAMGRMAHGGNYMMPDQRTVYMLDSDGPGALFKFVADTARNLGSGRLFAYRHDADTLGNHWISLPRGRDSLQHARRFAFQGGATIFNGLSDIDLLDDGSFLISEKGKDSANFAMASAIGGKVAPHLERLHIGNKMYVDKHGRILRYDPKTEKITVFLECGHALEDKSIVLSNPDNIAVDKTRGLLVVQEHLTGTSDGRIPRGTGVLQQAMAGAPRSGNKGTTYKVVNEIYFLDLKKPNPQLDDLHRFAVLPVGYAATGVVFSPDFKSLFMNLQVSNEGAPAPLDKSMTVVISGFGD
jgi:secreted PhoX family phosphatase